MPDEDFCFALGAAVELLRGLPRHRESVTTVRQTVEQFAAAHPSLDATLVVDQPPDSQKADFDLILAYPQGGNVAINYQPDDGLPWAIDHASHWAANQVVTVGERALSVPAALMALRARGLRELGALEQLVDHCILLEAAAGDAETVPRDELQRACDDFRRRRGLFARDAMLEWLGSLGISLAEFGRHIETTVRIARVRRRVAEARAAAHLAANRRDFELVTAHWIETATHACAVLAAGADDIPSAVALLAQAEDATFSEVRGTRLACDLPEALRDLEIGGRCGPVGGENGFLVGTILNRRPPLSGPTSLKTAGEAAVKAWLAECRREVDIRWHWL